MNFVHTAIAAAFSHPRMEHSMYAFLYHFAASFSEFSQL